MAQENYLEGFIQNDDFYYEVDDFESKIMKEMLYEFLENDQKKKLGKNNEAKITLYNALLRKEYERVFMCKTTKEVWHTLIITHQGNSQVKNTRCSQSSMKKLLIVASHDSTLFD
ncbi:hypothetical protein Tco_1076062 [Tanacetum coccineum]